MVLYGIYFRLTGFIVQPMNLVTLAGRVQIQLLQTMQPLALGGALVPRGQNIKLKLFNNRTKPCWDISLDCRAREDHIPSFEVPMGQLEHHSGDSHVSPEVVAQVPAVAVRVWRWPRKCPTPPPRGLIKFQSYLCGQKSPWRSMDLAVASMGYP